MALNLREREQCIFAGNFPEFLSTKIPKTTNPMHSHIHSSRLVSKAFLFAAALAASAVPALADGYYLSSGTDSVSEGETLTLSVDDGYKCYEAGILLGYDESDYDSDLNAFLSGVYAYEISSGRYEYCYESFTYLLGISGSAEFVNNGEITLTDGWWYDYYDEETGDEIYIDGYGAAIVSENATFTNNGTVSCDDNNVYVVGNASFVNNGEILGALEIYLLGNATFTNSETGTVEVYEEIHVSENASFVNEGSLNVSYGIWLSGNGEFTNSSALDYAGIEFDLYAEDGSATFTNDGTIDEGDERISVCFNFWSWTEGEYFSESSSGTFVNSGTINGSVSVWFDYDTEGNSSAGTVSDYDWSGRMNFVNRGTISGSVYADSYVAVTLVQGSEIGGDLELGNSSWYYSDSGSGLAVSDSDVLNILLDSGGGSEALIDGDLILKTATTISVSVDEDSVVAEKYTVQLFAGELVLDTNSEREYSEYYDEELEQEVGTYTVTILSEGSLTATSGTFVVDGTTYTWELDTETGILTARSENLGEEITIADEDEEVSVGSNDYASFDTSLDSYTGTVSGSGELHSTSDIEFSGDLSDFTGTTYVDAGTFTVTGGTLGTGTISVSGTLELDYGSGTSKTLANATSGSGTILVSSGTVSFAAAVGAKTLSVASGATISGSVSLTNSSGSALVLAGTLALDAAEGESVSATGTLTVTLASTAKLSVENAESVLASAGTVTIFSADTLTISGDSALSVADFLLTDDEISQLASETALVYSTDGGLSVQIASNYVSVSGLHDGLSELASLVLADLLYDEFEPGLYTEAELAALLGADDDSLIASALAGTGNVATLLEVLSPLSYASMIAVPVAAFQNDVRTILSRTALGRYEKYDAGEDESGWEFFCQFQYTNLENDDADDTPTFDYELSGILAGADYRASRTLIVGLTAAGDSGDIDVHHSGGKIEVSDYRITVYASKLVADTIAVDCGLQLGYGDYEIKRKTAYGKVTGDAESRSVGAFVNAGTILVISSDKGLYAEPFVGVNVMHTSVNDFSEGGSGGMFKIDDFDRLTVEANVGVNFAWIFTLAGTTSRLGFGIAYTHEFEDEVDIDAALLGGTGDYEVTAAMFSSDRISLSPKIEIGLATGLSAYAGYTLDVGTDSSVAHSANIGVRAHF